MNTKSHQSKPETQKSNDDTYAQRVAFAEELVADLSGKTNRTPESVAKRYELDLIECLPINPPRICEMSSRGDFLDSVAVPETVNELLHELRAMGMVPIPKDVQLHLERLVADFNGVHPNTICCTSNLILRGKGWRRNLTERLTGFEYWPTSEGSGR